MANAVVRINDLSGQIATAAEEQSRVTEEINRNMVAIRDMLAHLMETAQASGQNTETLGRVNQQLQQMVHRFKV
jgi:methyl-accepting chemotaxis protein